AVADLEPDPLELAGQLLDVDIGELVLEGERLELGGLDEAPLLARLDHRAGALGFQQFSELILRQRLLHTLSMRIWDLLASHRKRFVLRIPASSLEVMTFFTYSAAAAGSAAGCCSSDSAESPSRV